VAWADKMPFMEGRELTHLGHLLRFFTGHTSAFDSEQKMSN